MMNGNTNIGEKDSSSPSPTPPKVRKFRGPYKLWIQESGVTPRTTAQSRKKSALRRLEQPLAENDKQVNDPLPPAPECSFGLDSNEEDSEPETRMCVGKDSSDMDLPDSSASLQSLCIGACICGKCRTNEDSAESTATRKERINWEEPLLPSIPTTKYEAFLMVLHLTFRHSMTGPFVEDLLNFVNAVLVEKVLPTSEYMFRKLFQPRNEMKVHFFCPNCECYLGPIHDFDSATTPCPNCEAVCNVKDLSDNFFITLSIKEQLERILRQPEVKLISQDDRTEGVYSDMVDGDLYRELKKPDNSMSDPNSLSLFLNTDGAQVFHSAKGSLWPVQFIVPEVTPEVRFKEENVGLCGVYFGKSAPNMTTFLKPIKEEINALAKDGVLKLSGNGEFVKCPVFGLLWSLDSVAKKKVQAIMQYNGTNGCGYCYHPNIPVEGLTGNALRYVALKDDGSFLQFPYRTHDEMLRDMVKAHDLDQVGLLKRSKVGTPEETLDHVNGLKGLSVLADAEAFDLVFGFAIDYLHHFLNVVETLLSLICDSPSKSKKCWKDENFNVSELDRRLESITPPQGMSTRSKAVSNRAEWKGKSYRSALLYYLLPCLVDLQAQPYFSNLQKLSTAFHILLRDDISSEELVEAGALLEDIVKTFNILYGSENVTYNVHLCTHVALMVKLWGPLWAYSNFVFESGNGRLTRLREGTRGVITQIARKFLTVQSVSDYVREHNVSANGLSFCSNIMTFKYVEKRLFLNTRELLAQKYTQN